MEDSFLFTKTLPDGRIITVVPLTFGRARLCIGFDEDTYEDGW
jgi:hypothetical protein